MDGTAGLLAATQRRDVGDALARLGGRLTSAPKAGHDALRGTPPAKPSGTTRLALCALPLAASAIGECPFVASVSVSLPGVPALAPPIAYRHPTMPAARCTSVLAAASSITAGLSLASAICFSVAPPSLTAGDLTPTRQKAGKHRPVQGQLHTRQVAQRPGAVSRVQSPP
ncbi:hypothetical protein K505DRAFT_341732 [Melanomma pulvis-pyrius CBS 109.77]|uniref:Uncharacterized protein n=1 Tax=Melanomma pulvis-pyrius CBS 109.77 TaxID=1314802 RepID=A0A6A6WXM7_9PLEO|nr:hypothetical protein K505DRAFT_341732 [Melanomma pulvis-pyrius CBS 109.77]